MIAKKELIEMLIHLSRIEGYLHTVANKSIHNGIHYVSEILVRELKDDK